MKFKISQFVLAGVLVATLAACGKQEIVDLTGNQQLFEVRYDKITGNLHVAVHPGLHIGQTLHVRVRQGGVGQLNCAAMAPVIPRIDNNSAPDFNGGTAFQGPFVDTSLFLSPYDNSWLEGPGPTPEMIQYAMDSVYTIDLCLMNGGSVVRGAEMDIRRALDRSGTGKFDGYDENEEIRSVVAYAKACVYQLGEIPFFEKISEGDYKTYNCLDSTPIPTTVTDANGAAT
jgi:hypothetical protein